MARREDAAEIEARLEELEGIAASLGEVPEGELSGVLERAVALLREVNAGIEGRMRRAGEDAEKAGDLLAGIDLGPFDEAMKGHSPLETVEPPARETGPRADREGDL